jgi:hypothetical protein
MWSAELGKSSRLLLHDPWSGRSCLDRLSARTQVLADFQYSTGLIVARLEGFNR